MVNQNNIRNDREFTPPCVDLGRQDAVFNMVFEGDLKGRAVRGAAISFGGQGVKFFLQLVSTMVLARLLTPQDFGLIAMVVAVTGFMLIFKDLGLSAATVQKAEINHAQISTLFWINTAIGFAIMLITIALAPVVVWFYKEPKLLWVTIALASGFILSGLTVQHQALLTRQMRFSALVVIDIIALSVSIVIGIAGAWAGLRYWALVLMQLAMPLTTVVGVWIASGWRPGLPTLHSGVRSILAFGGNLTGYGFVNYFGRTFDNILLGRYWGESPLGFYTKAYSLLLLPIGQIVAPMTAVAIPTLSRLQNEPERFRHYYLKAIKLISYVSMPLIVAMAVLSNEIVAVVLGKQWMQACPIFRILAVAALWQPVGSTIGWVFVSLGQTRRMFIWACIAIPLIIISFLIGLPWGAIGVASGYSISSCILIYPQFVFALKHTQITAGDVFSVILRPLAASVVMGIIMFIAGAHVAAFGPISIIAISLFAGGIALSLLACGFRSIGRDIKDIMAAVNLNF